ncbi:MAG: hypothetical protein ACK2UW_20020 [Anaerolineales bacterium]|jgi:hypothetical protein
MMDAPCNYEIRIEGQLTERWTEWFDGLAIRSGPEGETLISGTFADQAALFGTLNKIQALNLPLISVRRIA